MKRIFFLLSILIPAGVFAAPGIHEALKNPSAVTVLKLCGEKNEAALLTKNAKNFSALTHIILADISDSVLAEQDLLATAACSNVSRLDFEKCGLTSLSGALKMLVAVREISISGCEKLSADAGFAALAQMPSLKTMHYETSTLKQLPRTFFQLRGLEKISIRNNDLSLADGYALNTSSPQSLLVKDSLCLGFGASKLVLEYTCYDKASLQSHISIMRDLLQGAAGVNGEMTLPQRAAAFSRNHPLIHPPIAGLDVRRNVYSLDAGAGGLLEYPSGTKITFPAHAFADADGNEIKGAVTIDYREFRDPVDILVSGIPMVYDSAGKGGEFESAGMFEMNASVNGKEVFLAPGKQADLQFAVVDTASTYNFYRLDEKKGWEYLQPTGKTESTQDATAVTTTTEISKAIPEFISKTAYWKRASSLKDTTSFANVYADTNYFYDEKRAAQKKYDAKRVYKEATNWRLHRVSAEKGVTCFTLTSGLSGMHYFGQNPEANAYNGITWMLNDRVDAATLRKLKSSRSGISDIRITYEGGADYSMELKLPNGFRTFSVTAVKVNDKYKAEALPEKRCMQMNKQYTRSLQRREKKFDRDIKTRITAHRKWEKKLSLDSVNTWTRVKGLMTDKEKEMSFRDWVTHVKKSRASGFVWTEQSEAAGNQVASVYQALSVMKFGVYNCDQIRRINKPVEVNAVALLPDGKEEPASEMFVIDLNHNQAFAYQGYVGTPIHIAFGQDSRNKLIVVNPDGSVSVADEDAFRARTGDAENTRFPATKMSEQPLTTQQLREFIYPQNIAQK